MVNRFHWEAPRSRQPDPGHTLGCTTWTMRIPDGGRTYDVLIACGGLQEGARLVNNKNYPQIAEDFARSIKTLKALPADVFLGAHSWFSIWPAVQEAGERDQPVHRSRRVQSVGRQHGQELQRAARRAEEEPARELTGRVRQVSLEALCSATGHLLIARDQGTTRNAINVRAGPAL